MNDDVSQLSQPNIKGLTARTPEPLPNRYLKRKPKPAGSNRERERRRVTALPTQHGQKTPETLLYTYLNRKPETAGSDRERERRRTDPKTKP